MQLLPLEATAWQSETSQTDGYPTGVHPDPDGNQVDFTDLETPYRAGFWWANWDGFEGTPSPVGDYEWEIKLIDANNDGWIISFEHTVVEEESGNHGDFNHDSDLDINDLELMERHIHWNGTNEILDLDGSGLVEADDLHIWVTGHTRDGEWFGSFSRTWIGDANLDGQFNSGDLVNVFHAGMYETDTDAMWRTGDWNVDRRFNSSDLVAAFQDGGYERGRPGPAFARPVPEPSSLVSVVIAVLILAFATRVPLVGRSI